MQGRVAKLNVSLSTSNRADQSNLGVNENDFNPNEMSDREEDEDMDVPENVEEIIELLLSGLRDMVCLKGEIFCSKFCFSALYYIARFNEK